jgi:MinD-like ATPase involved in chromosome partitioning or flagellar assembly
VDVAKVIDEHYHIRVMDSGNQYSSSAFAGAVETADVLVIPTMNSQDSIRDAVELLSFLENHEDPQARALAKTAVIVRLSDGRPEIKVERYLEALHAAGVDPGRVFSVPYDAHIAERGQISLGKLSQATREAFTVASAGVINQLQIVVNGRRPN